MIFQSGPPCKGLQHWHLSVQAQEFGKVLVPLFKQLAKCLNSSHFQVRWTANAGANLLMVQVAAQIIVPVPWLAARKRF